MLYSRRFWKCLNCCLVWSLMTLMVQALSAAEPFQFGFGKRDITPSLPMRLSGYSNRTEPARDALEKLQVRSMVMKTADGPAHAIVSVDLLGLAASQNAEIAKRVEAAYKIPRERLVVSCTHTHTGPQLTTPASNLLSTPFTPEERDRALAYTEIVIQQILAAIGDSIQSMKPGKLYLGEGHATFAMNRRTLVNGQWVMIHNPNGPVDHSLPILKITDLDGTVRGLIFNYACHATTLGPNDNQYNPDWPGYAAKYLEEKYAGVTALSLIGCGADANPEPRAGANVKDAVAVSMAHGRAAAEGVNEALDKPLTEITEAPVCSFGFAPLAFDLPSAEEFKARLEDKNVTIRQHAQNMLNILQKRRMLPSTYPLPLQSWQFGNQLNMIFMGGEVVVDYALRLKKELSPGYVWVTAYTNDDPGYLASERVRSEGGYEVDFSMYFYNQPGRWATGTEELVISRIKELREHPQAERAREPDEALLMFRIPKGLKIEIAAAEPLVMDPVNFAFATDGSLWVVEMADYPLGDNGQPMGRVVHLKDVDHDGKFDERTVFLDRLPYPTGVFPWRDGVLVSAAPDILFARDRDGDGKADEKRSLYSGFGDFNPQHRMNGFAYGLDHRLYLAGGDPNRIVHSELLKKDVNLLGNDFQIEPESGSIAPDAGRSQFGRSRDDWGHWFGNDNAHPWYHYVMPESALARNPFVIFPKNIVDVYGNGETPRVYPSSQLAARFNELHTANRFTSACSPIVFRDVTLGRENSETGLICDPVHNLVQQIELKPEGVTFDASRKAAEDNQEFLASTDQWFRPVRLATGPDGALWVADMYRQVIEHPEWIPDHWQSQLDLRAGADRGRIYRITRTDQKTAPLPTLSSLSNSQVVDLLKSSNGTLRDMAQQLLIERKAKDVIGLLVKQIRTTESAASRIQMLWTLHHLGDVPDESLSAALADPHPQVRITAVQLCESAKSLSKSAHEQLLRLAIDNNLEVRFRLAIALGNVPQSASALATLMRNDASNQWVRAAVMSSAVPHAGELLRQVLRDDFPSESRQLILEPLVATLMGSDTSAVRTILTIVADQPVSDQSDWALSALAALVESLGRRKESLFILTDEQKAEFRTIIPGINSWFAQAGRLARDQNQPEANRLLAIRLLGRGFDQQENDRSILISLVSAREPQVIQSAALSSLGRLTMPDAATDLLANWKQQTPASQSQVIQILLTRAEWTTLLLDALETRKLSVSDLSATDRSRLTKHADRQIANRAATLLANQVTSNRQKVLADYAVAQDLKGDLSRGKMIFQKSCSSCHQFQGQGNAIGANLATLQDRSTRALLTAILDPNQAVEGKFRSYTIVLNDGRTLTGMIVDESATNLTLATSNGALQTLLRSEIDELVNTGLSFMPEGLEKDLPVQDIADVIAHLQSNSPETNAAGK